MPTNERANERFKIKEIALDDEDNYLAETFPMSQTERYNYNDHQVIVYKKKLSKDKTYNNNTVYVVKQKNNNNTINKNISSNERVVDNNYNTINKYNNITFKVSKGDTSKINQKRQLYVNHSSKNLNFNIINKDLDVRQKHMNEEINNKEIKEKTTDNKNNTNYKMTDIMQKS